MSLVVDASVFVSAFRGTERKYMDTPEQWLRDQG